MRGRTQRRSSASGRCSSSFSVSFSPAETTSSSSRIPQRMRTISARAQAVSPSALGQQALPVQCRRLPGPWRVCRLTIESLGRHWWLQVGRERWVLRADGRGGLTLESGPGPARPVQPLWQLDRSLCWDGHCIKGNFPLD